MLKFKHCLFLQRSADMHSHGDLYRHSPECPRVVDTTASCTCTAPRFRRVFFIAITFALCEWVAGYVIGSGALRGDAWHLLMDSMTDASWWLFASIALRSATPDFWGRYGERVQATLMTIAGCAMIVEVFFVGHHENINGLHLLVAGSIAYGVNYWRFRVLHPGGGVLTLLRGLLEHIRSGNRNTQRLFVGQVLHILLDVGVSLAVAVSGGVLLVAPGAVAATEYTVGGIATLLMFASAAGTYWHSTGGGECHHH